MRNPGFKQDFFVLNFGLVRNSGIAFGIPFKSFLQVFIICLIFILIIMFFKSDDNYMKISMLFVLLGALSNLWDRLFVKAVIDYIRIWPVNLYFNIADMMITMGVVMIILKIDRKEKMLEQNE